MNDYKIRNVAQIITGYSFRKAIVNSPNGKYKIIQAKDISNKFEITGDNLVQTNIDKPNSNAFVKNNDIVLSSRGKFQSAVINSNKLIIASSSIYIIRITSKEIVPQYLSIFINSQEGQSQISKLTSGNYIKFISRPNLEDLTIKIPSIQKQNLIINLEQNVNQQQKLLKRKIEIIKSISQKSLIKILK